MTTKTKSRYVLNKKALQHYLIDHDLTQAGLIDCPTCRLELTEIETHGNAKVRIYECSECGRTCEEIYGKYERCPHCGAEVVDED